MSDARSMAFHRNALQSLDVGRWMFDVFLTNEDRHRDAVPGNLPCAA